MGQRAIMIPEVIYELGKCWQTQQCSSKLEPWESCLALCSRCIRANLFPSQYQGTLKRKIWQTAAVYASRETLFWNGRSALSTYFGRLNPDERIQSHFRFSSVVSSVQKCASPSNLSLTKTEYSASLHIMWLKTEHPTKKMSDDIKVLTHC